MKRITRSRCRFLLAAIILVHSAISVIAQTPPANPPDRRGLGVETRPSTKTVRVEERSREAKPELVLQTGYNGYVGATRLIFSPDGRLLATATLGSETVKLWETATGRELRNVSSVGQSSPDSSPSIAFSRNSLRLATADLDSIKIWDVTTGRQLQSFTGSQTPIRFIAFTRDDRALVTINDAIRVWDLTNGLEVRKFDLTALTLTDTNAIALSPANQLAILVHEDSRARIKVFDLTSAREVASVDLTEQALKNAQLAFTQDGRLLMAAIVAGQIRLSEELPRKQEADLGSASQDGTISFNADGRLLAFSEGNTVRVWDVVKRRRLSVLKPPSNSFFNANFRLFASLSDDGKSLATGGFNTPTVLWETKTGKQLLKFNGRTNQAYKVAFSADGTRLSSGGRTSWDLRTGRGLRIVNGQSGELFGLPTSDGRLLAVFDPSRKGLAILETASGRPVQTLATDGPGAVLQAVSFSRDGNRLATKYAWNEDSKTALSKQIKIWDVRSGNTLHTFTLGSFAKDAIFSPDGLKLATLDAAGQVLLWDSGSASKLREPNMDGRKATSLAFSNDGSTLAIASSGEVVLWNLASGDQRGAIIGQTDAVTAVVFSRDGRLLASSTTDNKIRIWEVNSRRELLALAGHTTYINSIDFSPDSTLIASAADDGSTFLWDANTGDHLLTLISLDDGGEWIAVTPQGVFDGTPLSWNQILWRYNQDTFNVAPIEWFFNEFYSPGLIADFYAGKRPRVAEDVSRKDRRQPLVKLALANGPPPETGLSSRTVKVRIEITDAPPDADNPGGTGARDLRLFRNGSLVKVWPGDVLKGQTTVTLEQNVTITAGANRLTAYAFNRDNVKSKDALLSLKGAETLRRGGTAYIIAIGLNEYANPRYNLKYAVADAQSFGEELRRRLSQQSRFDHIEVVSLLNEEATKANILAAVRRLSSGSANGGPLSLERLKRAQPEDTVVFFFAGHGTAQAQRFYLVPHDLGYMGERNAIDEQGLETVLLHSLSDQELEQAVEGMDAGHLLLFIDACNSGQALEADEKRRGPMNSKGLAQLAYEKGMYILTAAQSYQAALEAAQFGHGLLTYALVEEGLKTPVADVEPKDGVLNAREWLDFAVERVPQMQQEKMKESRGIGLGVAFMEGEQNIADPEKRSVQRPRVFYRRELEANPLVVAQSNSRSPGTPAGTAGGSTGRFSRWVDLQTATTGTRYRFVESSSDVTVANQMQSFVQFRGRFKFDRKGDYSLNAGVFTGNSFVLGFNDTGIGTGDAITNLYLKQLYFSAKPIRGVEVQFGGLYFNRGESTEITTYDNDGYLMGERVVIQRPRKLFFDEISATYAFLGDLTTPNINKRWHRLKKSNYHQFLVSKKIGERAVVSGDYTFQSGIDTLRQALRVNTPEFKSIDFFRVEVYERVQTNPEAGLAAYAEKTLMNRRLTLGGGYAQIDRDYGGLNADRFNIGRRIFVQSSYRLSPEFTITTFYTRGFKNDFPISNRTRFELFFTYNLLKTLQKTGLF